MPSACLIYFSPPTAPDEPGVYVVRRLPPTLIDSISRAEVEELVERSRVRNEHEDITGLLLLRQSRVMQVLEGPERAVRDLFRRISDDPRHHGVTTVWTSSADERRFPSWTMGLQDLDDAGPLIEAEVPGPDTQPLTPEQHLFIDRRTHLLRRALASGDRLIGTLAIILHAHETESSLGTGTIYLRCRECRVHDDPGLDQYPCATASNALWALDAVLG